MQSKESSTWPQGERHTQQNLSQHTRSQDDYLHAGCWQFDGHLYEQPWAKEAMANFQRKQEQWRQKKHTICSEQWPVRT